MVAATGGNAAASASTSKAEAAKSPEGDAEGSDGSVDLSTFVRLSRQNSNQSHRSAKTDRSTKTDQETAETGTAGGMLEDGDSDIAGDGGDLDVAAAEAEVSEALEASERDRLAMVPPAYTGSGVGLLYDARMARHHSLDDNEHPEHPLRIVRVFKALQAEGLVDRCVRVPCRPATKEELLLTHSSKHVDAMLAVEGLPRDGLSSEQAKYRSVFFCPDSMESALLAAGATLEATERVCAGDVERAICIVRPPGHHAEPSCAMGFCMFGNVGVAAAEAQHRGWSKRTLIIDWDIHHGNGTQAMFYEDSAVLFFSVHRYDSGRFFPGGIAGHFSSHGKDEGAGYSVNVPWDWRGADKRGFPALGDAEYFDVWERVLLPIAEDFKPDLIYISAGFDAAVGDPLGCCNVTPACYHELTRRLIDRICGRIVLVLEGGYNLNSISQSMVAATRAMLNDPMPEAPDHDPANPVGVAHHFHADVVSKVRAHLAQFWPSLRDAGEIVAAAEVVQIRVPAAALHGTPEEMEKALRDHVDEAHSYEQLRARQQTLLFQLEEMPKAPPHVKEQAGWTALRQSFEVKAPKGSPYMLAVISIVSAEQALRNVSLALSSGMVGVWLVNNGHAHSPLEAALPHVAVQRTNLKGPSGGAAGKAGRAQLDALAECFAYIREQYSDVWVGISLPQLPPAQAFKWVSSHCPSADGLWLHHFPCKPADVSWQKVTLPDGAEASHAIRLEKWLKDDQPALKAVKRERQISTWKGLVFACVACQSAEQVHHHQEEVEHMDEACQALLAHAATLASFVCDVVITGASDKDVDGPCPPAKLEAMEGKTPLALLSRSDVAELAHTKGNIDVVVVDLKTDSADGAPPLDVDVPRLRTLVERWKPEDPGTED